MNLVIASATIVLEENLLEDSLVQKVVVQVKQVNALSDAEAEFIDSPDEFWSGSECPLGDFSEFEREQQLDPAC